MSQSTPNPSTPEVSAAEPNQLEVNKNSSQNQDSINSPAFDPVIGSEENASNKEYAQVPQKHIQSSQFHPLDLLSESKERNTYNNTLSESDLDIDEDPNQSQITFSLLESIQWGFLSGKTASIIKKMTQQYWEAYRSQTFNDFDLKKTLIFAYILFAIFQLKSLSIQELKSKKEIEIYHFDKEELKKYATSLNKEILTRISNYFNKKNLTLESLLECLSNIENIDIRRSILSNIQILPSIVYEKKKKLKEELSLTVQQNRGQANKIDEKKQSQTKQQTHLPAFTASSIIFSQKGSEISDIISEQISNLKKGGSELGSNRQTEVHQPETNITSSEKDNVNSQHQDFSIMTQGNVTHLDISLPMAEFSESSQRIDNQTKTNEAVQEGQIIN